MRSNHAAPLRLVLLLVGLAAGGAARGAEDAPALEAWPCASCPYDWGWQGEVAIGAQLATGATGWTARDHGYDGEGLQLGVDVDLLRLAPDGVRFELLARGLGLPDDRLVAELRRADAYAVGVEWWSKRWTGAERARTPFLGAGSGLLTLPGGWVRGDDTGDLTQLAAALHPLEQSFDRERVGAHADWWSRNGWRTSVEARIETKRGVDAIGGAFLTRATLLPEPVDQVTESMTASAAYAGRGWDVALRYLLSTFDAGAEVLEWDNPFLGLHPTADVGQLALAPDNEFQQLSADARWRGAGGLRLEGGVALGLGTQDAALLPATANPGLATALPRASADAEVATTLAYARAAIPTGPLLLRAELRHDARDNETPPDLWTQVVTDTYVGAAVVNPAYGQRRTRARVDADWSLDATRFLARVQSTVTDRDGVAVARTRDDLVALEVHGFVLEALDWGMELAHDARSASAYAPEPAQNPLLRIWPYAERSADRFAVSLGLMPTAALSLALRVEQRREDYPDSELGLTERDDLGYGLDAAYALDDEAALTGFYQRQTLATDQAGSAAWAGADWIGRSEDVTEAYGVSYVAPRITDRLGLRLELNHTAAAGLVTIDQGVVTPFPETVSRLRQLLVAADYRIDERIALRCGLRWERLDVADWALAGVDPATVPNLLWSGQRAPDQELEIVELGVRIGL